MSAPESILLKVKLLLNLVNSPNPNEAETARAMADKLIAKYNITEEELKSLEEKKPLYGAENKLFSTTGVIGWKQQLALAIGKFFYCHIIQEEMRGTLGDTSEYNYYVYGDPEDEVNVKLAFNAFTKKVEELILCNCAGRGPIYIASYGEGVSEAIRNNIYWEGIDIPEVKAPARALSEEKVLNDGPSNMSKHKEEKEKPEDKSVDVNSQSLIKDIMAYFRGLEDGKALSLKRLLELEMKSEQLKELPAEENEDDQS